MSISKESFIETSNPQTSSTIMLRSTVYWWISDWQNARVQTGNPVSVKSTKKREENVFSTPTPSNNFNNPQISYQQAIQSKTADPAAEQTEPAQEVFELQKSY